RIQLFSDNRMHPQPPCRQTIKKIKYTRSQHTAKCSGIVALQQQKHSDTPGEQIKTGNRIWNIFLHIKQKAIRQLTDGLKILIIHEYYPFMEIKNSSLERVPLNCC